jgi:hypothetical protein
MFLFPFFGGLHRVGKAVDGPREFHYCLFHFAPLLRLVPLHGDAYCLNV